MSESPEVCQFSSTDYRGHISTLLQQICIKSSIEIF